ncbi:unnamed protein product [Thelazia callipaeda]|uniref:DDE_Tnp_1_7 domain-containing protein n=1 Tax=Thelazia callipaeda TaxID=103827 RepID=A0A0N5DB25_THECL|nr:unnamed protein product [Thelazia callipaeda]
MHRVIEKRAEDIVIHENNRNSPTIETKSNSKSKYGRKINYNFAKSTDLYFSLDALLIQKYKQIVSWDSMFSALEDNEVLRISSRLSKICTETEITSKPKRHLTLNEFIILDAVMTTTSF